MRKIIACANCQHVYCPGCAGMKCPHCGTRAPRDPESATALNKLPFISIHQPVPPG